MNKADVSLKHLNNILPFSKLITAFSYASSQPAHNQYWCAVPWSHRTPGLQSIISQFWLSIDAQYWESDILYWASTVPVVCFHLDGRIYFDSLFSRSNGYFHVHIKTDPFLILLTVFTIWPLDNESFRVNPPKGFIIFLNRDFFCPSNLFYEDAHKVLRHLKPHMRLFVYRQYIIGLVKDDYILPFFNKDHKFVIQHQSSLEKLGDKPMEMREDDLRKLCVFDTIPNKMTAIELLIINRYYNRIILNYLQQLNSIFLFTIISVKML